MSQRWSTQSRSITFPLSPPQALAVIRSQLKYVLDDLRDEYEGEVFIQFEKALPALTLVGRGYELNEVRNEVVERLQEFRDFCVLDMKIENSKMGRFIGRNGRNVNSLRDKFYEVEIKADGKNCYVTIAGKESDVEKARRHIEQLYYFEWAEYQTFQVRRRHAPTRDNYYYDSASEDEYDDSASEDDYDDSASEDDYDDSASEDDLTWRDLPAEWIPSEEKLYVPLDCNSSEYRDIEKLFLEGNKSSISMSVCSIRRMQNPALYRQYQSKKDEIANRANPPNNIEKRLFHGTDEKTINLICLDGFNRSYAGKNATLYGKGTYFSTESSYSNSYTKADGKGRCQMLVADVLTGDYCKGESYMIDAPRNPATQELYDSVVDQAGQNSIPAIYVVFKDWSAYPSYVVTYTAN